MHAQSVSTRRTFFVIRRGGEPHTVKRRRTVLYSTHDVDHVVRAPEHSRAHIIAQSVKALAHYKHIIQIRGSDILQNRDEELVGQV
jgi:hypothetical protein